MTTSDAPRLDGVHHVKLPVADLEATEAWYSSRLGYRPVIRFTDQGRHTGTVMIHPNGGPMISFVAKPELAARASGFDYFSIGVPDKASLEELAGRLTAHGDAHAGVHFATIGWILPNTHDPDGHEVRFYTSDHHTDFGDSDAPMMVENPVATEAEREQRHQAEAGQTR